MMCGIVGFVGNPKDKYASQIIDDLLYIDTLRGFDSTGVCTVNQAMDVCVVKSPSPGWDFLTTRAYKKLRDTFEVSKAVIGHNRAASIGKVTFDNTHPFTVDEITLVHNGTLHEGYKRLVGTAHQTDSETIAAALSACINTEDTKKVLEALRGAYALVWFDAADSSVHFARNNERPLNFLQTGRGRIFASEKGQLLYIQAKYGLQGEITALPPGEHVTIDISGSTHYTYSTTFTPWVSPKIEYFSYGNYSKKRLYPVDKYKATSQEYKPGDKVQITWDLELLAERAAKAHGGIVWGTSKSKDGLISVGSWYMSLGYVKSLYHLVKAGVRTMGVVQRVLHTNDHKSLLVKEIMPDGYVKGYTSYMSVNDFEKSHSQCTECKQPIYPETAKWVGEGIAVCSKCIQ